MDFVAIDVETANADLASICQVGIVGFKDGRVVESWQSLVDPEDYFHWANVAVHRIDEDAVRGAPTMPQLFDVIAEKTSGRVLVCHTHFDRVALSRSVQRYGLQELDCSWLDSARVVRRTWAEFARTGYNLPNITEWLGIEYQAHDAEEDARAAGEVLLRAMSESGLSVQGWLERVRQPVSGPSKPIKMDGDPDGPLFGEVVVFTGWLSVARSEAAALAAAAGCRVAPSVTKTTTLLVVGDQDTWKLAGYEKSAKHRRAEELIGRGSKIRILGEADFLQMVG